MKITAKKKETNMLHCFTQKWRWMEDDCPFQMGDFQVSRGSVQVNRWSNIPEAKGSRHHLSHQLTILWCVEGWLCQQEILGGHKRGFGKW